MTYEQALALLRQRYGTQPWTQASGMEVQSYLRSQGVPSAYITQIGTAYYTAQRTNTTIDGVLQSKGLLAPTTTTGTASTTSTDIPTISVSGIFNTPSTSTGSTLPSYTSPVVAPSAIASQESGAIGAASIASQMTAPTTTSVPVVSNPITSSVVTSTAPATTQTSSAVTPPTYAPSNLAAGESGAIGAASISSQMAADKEVASTLNTLNSNDKSWYQSYAFDPVTKKLYVLTKSTTSTVGGYSELPPGSPLYQALMSGKATISNGVYTYLPTGATSGSAGALQQLKYVPGTTVTSYDLTTPATKPTTTTTPPVFTVPTAVTTPTSTIPVIPNPLTSPTPAGAVPVIAVPQIPAATTTPTATTAAMGGSLEDQMAYMSAIRRATAAKDAAKENAKFQRADIGTQYESQIRKAGREMYNQQIKALAALGARGISGAPGLSVAARRAGIAAPQMQYSGLINERQRQLGALERSLAQQVADYEETIRTNNEQLTRATTLANQLTGTGQ